MRLVGDHTADQLHHLVDAFTGLYQNAGTRTGKRSHLASLFASAGVDHPADLTESHLHVWCTGDGQPIANNTVRQRISEARTFLAWCHRTGHTPTNVALDLLAPHSPLKKYRKVYGKQQGKHPGRWLSHHDAFTTLIGATQDGTPAGLRDELVIRFGLLGLRQVEIAQLTWSNLDQLPLVHWIGKGHAPRQIAAGHTLCHRLDTYRTMYDDATDAALQEDWPVICKAVPGRNARSNGRRLAWCQPLNTTNGVFHIVNTAGHAAGLGHIAPHDLRRTAAGILHHDVNDDGAHFFDLLDIQKMLGHTDPATTMRSYLDPIDTAVIHRAASVLD